jgi:hypothetical protein
MHSSPKKPRAKTKANKQGGGIISSTTTTTTHGNISTEILEEQYQQYQETLQQQEREKTTVAVNRNMMHSHSGVVESFDTPVPPSRPTDAPSTEEGGPRRNGRGTFQRKMIVRRGLKVDRKALVAARVKRFTTERKGGEKQGLQKDKIQHGAENW